MFCVNLAFVEQGSPILKQLPQKSTLYSSPQDQGGASSVMLNAFAW